MTGRHMSDPLIAEFVPRTTGSELQVRVESGLVTFKARNAPETWLFGATLDGALTLDLDESRVLVNADFLWKRSQWKREALALPERAGEAQRLRLPNLTSEAVRADIGVLPVVDGDTLAIWIGSSLAARRVPLGQRVDALISSADTLVGLAVSIP